MKSQILKNIRYAPEATIFAAVRKPCFDDVCAKFVSVQIIKIIWIPIKDMHHSIELSLMKRLRSYKQRK